VTAYVDTSALLRLVLREAGAVNDLRSYESLISSELIAVESDRTLDRLRLQGSLTGEEAARRVRIVRECLEAIDLVLLRPQVLNRASEHCRHRSVRSMRCIWPPHWFGAIERDPHSSWLHTTRRSASRRRPLGSRFAGSELVRTGTVSNHVH